MVVEVALNYRSKKVDKLFDYDVPEELLKQITVGSCVTVPFGKGDKLKEGYVFAVKEASDRKLKTVIGLSHPEPLFDEKQLELIKWMRDRYLITYLDAVRAVAPGGISVTHEEWIVLKNEDVRGNVAQKIAELLKDNGGSMEINRLMGYFETNISGSLSDLEKKGKIAKEFREHRAVGDKIIRVAELSVDETEVRGAVKELEKANAVVQAKMLDILSECGMLSLADLVNFSDGSYTSVKTLEKKGFIKTYEITVLRELDSETDVKPEPEKELTEEQSCVFNELLDAVDKGVYSGYLLHGVTGSGKTEVYLRVIAEVRKRGKQAIMLVPEISLTPQTVARFRARFGSDVAIIHSGLSLGERYDQWKRIKSGTANIVVGARSAVFAPLKDIGAVIIDEEHEQSYKSEMTPRYETHEIAEFRARQHNALLLFASATPLVTSYYKALNGDIRLLEMKKRFNNNKMPRVEIVDLRKELESGNRSMLSRRLQEAIAENLKRGKQTILFLNRRGYSTFVSCRSCGFVAQCPNCNISLTYHKFSDTLKCHYCGYTTKNYTECPECKSRYIRYFGGGTQRIEEDISKLFPDATTIRMDIDTTGRKNSHERILKKFSEEKIDILIGTQMVTKGLDFPDVTLVGVISADTMLNIDDYRAKERTFSILEQVTGRAGRADTEGISIVQTYSPEDSSIVLMQRHDYKTFFENELKVRRAMRYPPFCELVAVIFSGKNERITSDCAKVFTKKLRSRMPEEQEIQILGPIPAYISKIKNKYIFRLLIKCENSDGITDALLGASEECEKNAVYDSISIVIDKNPNSMG